MYIIDIYWIWAFEFHILIQIFYILNIKNTEISVILDIKLNTVTVINFGGRIINYTNRENIIFIRFKYFILGSRG